VQELQADDRSQVSIAQLTLVVPHCMSTCHEARARSVAWSSRPPVRSLSSSRARCAAKNPPAPERLTQATAFAFGSGRMADKQCKAVGISRHCAFVLTLLAKSNVLRNLRNEGSILPLDKKWNERCAAFDPTQWQVKLFRRPRRSTDDGNAGGRSPLQPSTTTTSLQIEQQQPPPPPSPDLETTRGPVRLRFGSL
jgi:hypothetical protein